MIVAKSELEQNIDVRARVYCDERDLTNVEDLLRARAFIAHQSLMADLKPFVDIKVKFFSLFTGPRVFSDGKLTPVLTDEKKKHLAIIDEQIERVTHRYDFMWPKT